MDSFAGSDYQYRKKLALAALDKMQAKIATIKENSTIPITKRKENVAAYYALREFMKISESIINELIGDNNKSEQEHFLKGYERGKKDEKESAMGGIPNKYYDKEAFRATHELSVKNKWSELY